MEKSDYVTAFQNVLNVFFVLQEEIYLPASLGIDNIDLFASRHIEQFMISSDMEDLIRGENIKISKAHFLNGLTHQASIWRHFFSRRVWSALTTWDF